MSETLVRMPKLADTLVEGTLGAWLKQVGETVGQGEPLASIETDKVTTEMSSPAAGRLLEVLVLEGQTVPVETVIARLGSAETASNIPAAVPPGAQAERQLGPPKPTPVAARLLTEHGLAAEQVTSRPGRLTKHEVLKYLEDKPGAKPPLPLGEGGDEGYLRADNHPSPALRAVESTPRGRGGFLTPLTPMRRAIADHMLRARQTIPHGQTVMDADLTRVVAWRDLQKAAFQHAEDANLSFTVLFVYALARKLASEDGGPVGLGVAVALDAGLIVPVLRKAHSLTLGATARGLADLVSRARTRTLTPDETLGAKMTVTNVGSFGNLTASPIVPLGQVGILGPGLVERRPMPTADSGIRIGWRCRLSLMFDRRALDDLGADRLLRGIVDELHRIPDTN
jgi:2-oxoisovalerate dehydrogenase E2 component (dihydrolipoyl transacylase)